MAAAGQQPQHAQGVGGVGRFAEDGLAHGHHGIRAKDHGRGVHLGHGGGLEPGHAGGVGGGMFIDVRVRLLGRADDDFEGHSGQGQQFAATRRGRGQNHFCVRNSHIPLKSHFF